MTSSTPIPPDAVSRILEVAPEARLARRQHSEQDPKVQASKELTAIFLSLYDQGYSVSAIAKASGMTYHSVSARVKGNKDAK